MKTKHTDTLIKLLLLLLLLLLLYMQSVLRCVEGIPQQVMIQNMVSVTEKVKGDISHSFLQQLELGTQLEGLSKGEMNMS